MQTTIQAIKTRLEIILDVEEIRPRNLYVEALQKQKEPLHVDVAWLQRQQVNFVVMTAMQICINMHMVRPSTIRWILGTYPQVLNAMYEAYATHYLPEACFVTIPKEYTIPANQLQIDLRNYYQEPMDGGGFWLYRLKQDKIRQPEFVLNSHQIFQLKWFIDLLTEFKSNLSIMVHPNCRHANANADIIVAQKEEINELTTKLQNLLSQRGVTVTNPNELPKKCWEALLKPENHSRETYPDLTQQQLWSKLVDMMQNLLSFPNASPPDALVCRLQNLLQMPIENDKELLELEITFYLHNSVSP